MIPGRGPVTLNVGGPSRSREDVTIAVGYPYPTKAHMMVRVDRRDFVFYSQGRFAFARSGAAVVAAFRAGAVAVATGPGPSGGKSRVRDTFSLEGFTAAYHKIVQICPPGA